MGRWRVRLLAPGDRVETWEGEAEDGHEAQTLAEAAFPGAVAKSGSEVDA